MKMKDNENKKFRKKVKTKDNENKKSVFISTPGQNGDHMNACFAWKSDLLQLSCEQSSLFSFSRTVVFEYIFDFGFYFNR